MSDIELLTALVRDLIEAQMKTALLVVGRSREDRDRLLTERIAAAFERMAALLDQDGQRDFPSELATSLHTNALRIRDLAGRGAGEG